MQTLASHVDRLAGMLRPFVANSGTLVIRDDRGLWYYHREDWQPETGLTNKQWIALFHCSPPLNIGNECWGVVEAPLTDDFGPTAHNWTRGEIAGAIQSFVDRFEVQADGVSLRPIGKSKHLSAKRDMDLAHRRAELKQIITRVVSQAKKDGVNVQDLT
jgi:hypothetical protein